MRPIPKSMLIHSAAVSKEINSDWSSSNLERLGMLKDIRLEPSSKVVRDKNNKEIQLSATLFFDCKNSEGDTALLKEDNILDFQGDRYRIVAVDPLYERRRLHHYEAGVVRYAGKR